MFRFRPIRRRDSEQGYVLLTVVLSVALLAIAAIAMAPTLAFQMKRDREEELIHRGVQYTRAIQNYYKKFGKYPTRIEDLENTNQVRFLRRRYKDPVTGKDFKLLYLQDVQMSGGAAIGGVAGGINNLNGTQGPSAPGNFPGGVNNGPFSNTGLPNQGNGVNGGQNILQQVQQGFGGAAGPGGINQNGFGNGGNAGGNAGGSSGGATNQGAQNNEEDSGDAGSASGPGGQSPPTGATGTGGPGIGGPGGTASGSSNNNQVFGGGPVVGVVSISKDKTIRVFSKRDHYNQWQFMYDPTMDQGGLITTPSIPPVPGMGVGQPGISAGQVAAGSQGGAGGTQTAPGTQTPGQPGGQPNQPFQPVTQPPQMPPTGEPQQ